MRAAQRTSRPAAQPAAPRAATLVWRVNWWLLLATLAVLVAVAVPAALWHQYQLKRSGAAFLARADALAEEEKWDEASQVVQRYLRLFPEDTAARVRLAQTYDHVADESPAKVSTAERLLTVAVGLAPDRPELRLRHAQRLLDLRRCSEALAEVDESLKLQGGNPEALRLKAAAAYGDARMRGDFSSAAHLVANFRTAIAASAGQREQIELAVQLAEMYRRNLTEPATAERQALADGVINEMVDANAQDPLAWLARYLYRARNEEQARDEDLDRALELDPQHTIGLISLAAAERAQQRDESSAAQVYFEQAIAAQPNNPAGYLGLAELQARQQEFAQAESVLTRGLAAVSEAEQINLELTLAMVQMTAGELAAADRSLSSVTRRLEKRTRPATDRALLPLRTRLNSLRAQWHFQKQQYLQAIDLLAQVLKESPRVVTKQDATTRARLLMQLGQSYEALRHFDQAASAFKEAATIDPQAMQPQLAAARAWQAAGRVDEAAREFRQAVLRPEADDVVWAGLIEAEVRQQVMNDETQRSWQAVDEAVAQARTRFPASQMLATLAAQIDDVRHGTQRALQLMDEAQAANPQSTRATEGLMLAYEAQGQQDQADRVLERFIKGTESPFDRLMMRTTLRIARRQYDDASRELTACKDGAAASEQLAIDLRLANVAIRRGQLEEATKILTGLVQRDDRNEQLLELLADLALETKDLVHLAYWEDELKKQEGTTGTAWRFYRAQRLLSETSDDTELRLAEADRLAAEIVRLRPMWALGLVLEGQVAQRRGQAERAIEAYRQAIELGERRDFVQEQLAGLLYTTGRNEELERQLAGIGDAVTRSAKLAQIAISVRIRSRLPQEAVKLAREEVDRRPADAVSHLSLAQALVAAGEHDEAQAAFEKAIELDPQDVRCWQAQFGFFLTEGKRTEAVQTLEKMANTVKLAPRQLLPIVAQDQILLGDNVAAERTFRQLIDIAADDEAALRKAAQFFATNDPATAERCLRRARSIEPQARAPRLDLAAFLINRGGDANLAEAAELLSGQSAETKADPLSQGLLARLLLRRGQAEDHERGQKMLEDLAARGDASDDDRLLLVDLYQNEGHAHDAEQQAYVLVNRKTPQPAHLVRYIDLLLREGHGFEAGSAFEKLAGIDPDSFTTLSLRARLMAARKETAGIEPLVEAYMQRALPTAKAEEDTYRMLLGAGLLYAQLQMDAQAERTLRQAALHSAEGYQTLAAWLASHNRSEEAVAMCIAAATTDTTLRGAMTLVRSLIYGNASPELAARAEPLLASAAQAHGDNAEFLLTLATWRLVQEREDEAIPLLRQALDHEPKNSAVINNLATALGMRNESRAEALRLIDQALALSGRIAELLDTKGTLLLADGDATQAVQLLQEATLRPNSDPRHLFHLSLALRTAGKLTESREALQRARQKSLNAAVLTPRHRRQLTELEKDLADHAG